MIVCCGKSRARIFCDWIVHEDGLVIVMLGVVRAKVIYCIILRDNGFFRARN